MVPDDFEDQFDEAVTAGDLDRVCDLIDEEVAHHGARLYDALPRELRRVVDRVTPRGESHVWLDCLVAAASEGAVAVREEARRAVANEQNCRLFGDDELARYWGHYRRIFEAVASALEAGRCARAALLAALVDAAARSVAPSTTGRFHSAGQVADCLVGASRVLTHAPPARVRSGFAHELRESLAA